MTAINAIATKQESTKAPAMNDMIDQLVRFDGPPEQFLIAMLATQCRIAPAAGGAVLRRAAQDRVDVLGVYPPMPQGATAPVWLAKAVEASVGVVGKDTVVKPLPGMQGIYEVNASQHLILVPIRAGTFTGTAAYLVATNNPAIIERARERLELTLALLNLYEMRQALSRRNQDLERLRESMETLATLNEHARMRAATMALVNEIASRWQGERVALGFLKGRYVALVALSHTEKFTRKMKLVQDIEAAMEECLDQDVEVVYPPADKAPYVSRAAHDLSSHHGPTNVLSLPLRRDGDVVGVLTIERPVDDPFLVTEIETLRLMCDLSTARLYELYEHDRWIGAKMAMGTRKLLAKAVGVEHTWIKLIILIVFGFLCFATFVKGPDRVDSSFVIESTVKQVVTAPFAGYLASVNVEPGSVVKANETVLAVLDTTDLQLNLATSKAEKAAFLKEADQALRDGKKAEEQIALARADKVQAQISLIEYQISQAKIVAKIDGIVTTDGDLKQRIGARVEPKDVLFEVAPLTELRAELSVPENRIGDVTVGATGELASNAAPGTYLPFEVEKINPVAEVDEQKNVFKVRAKLTVTPELEQEIKGDRLKLGSQGVAKVDVGRRAYGYLWTRDFVNWIRMKLWI